MAQATAAGAVRPLSTRYSGLESPEQLAGDARISPSVREWLLNDWAEDLKAQLRASDESMASEKPGCAGELLCRVHIGLERLSPAEGRH